MTSETIMTKDDASPETNDTHNEDPHVTTANIHNGTEAPPSQPPKATRTEAPPEESLPPSPPLFEKKSVDIGFGPWIAEGGFCDIYELKYIKDLVSDEWILEPARNNNLDGNNAASATTRTGGGSHRRGRSSAFGSLGMAALSKINLLATAGHSPPNQQHPATTGATNHKRSASVALPSSGSAPKSNNNAPRKVPPLIQSATLHVCGKFRPPASNSSTTATPNPAAIIGNRPRAATHTGVSSSLPASSSPTTKTEERQSTSNLLAMSPGRSRRKSISKKDLANYMSQNDPPQVGAQFVIKCLKTKAFQDPPLLELGLKDLQVEMEILQKLHHPHIVNVRAYGQLKFMAASHHKTSSASSHDTNIATKQYPLIIMDRLGVTLEDKLEAWEEQHKKNTSVLSKMITHRHYSKDELCVQERLQILCDLTSALKYIHHQKMIYRDIKPENVGFDRHNDTLKVLDFGLVRDIRNEPPVKTLTNRLGAQHHLYQLTALTGSARYMAPEVARQEPYNESCDVYGVALVIWQVMSLQVPYAKFNVHKMFQQVYDCPHVRPSLEEWQPKANKPAGGEINSLSKNLNGATPQAQQPLRHEWLWGLLSAMWNPVIEERPSMKEVHHVLKEQLHKVSHNQSLSDEAGGMGGAG